MSMKTTTYPILKIYVNIFTQLFIILITDLKIQKHERKHSNCAF